MQTINTSILFSALFFAFFGLCAYPNILLFRRPQIVFGIFGASICFLSFMGFEIVYLLSLNGVYNLPSFLYIIFYNLTGVAVICALTAMLLLIKVENQSARWFRRAAIAFGWLSTVSAMVASNARYVLKYPSKLDAESLTSWFTIIFVLAIISATTFLIIPKVSKNSLANKPKS